LKLFSIPDSEGLDRKKWKYACGEIKIKHQSLQLGLVLFYFYLISILLQYISILFQIMIALFVFLSLFSGLKSHI